MRLLETKYFKEYVRTQTNLLVWVLDNVTPPPKMVVEAQDKLEILRRYLDTNGIKMPLPKYVYNPEDKKTWGFLPAPVNSGHHRMTIRNPNFKAVDTYEHNTCNFGVKRK